MSLHIYKDVEQRSTEWYQLRLGLLTASAIGRLITPKTVKVASNDDSRGLTAALVAERVTGWPEPHYVNADMQRGIDEEPRARDHYAETRGVAVTEVGLMILETDTFRLGYSPDGLVGDDGLIEIKAPRAKTHIQTWRTNSVPLGYQAQIQAALRVSGREWVDFISWCGGMPPFVKRVGPDQRWFDAIDAAAAEFEANAARMVAEYEQATYGLPTTERYLADVEIF